jgi:hypothetical protein
VQQTAAAAATGSTAQQQDNAAIGGTAQQQTSATTIRTAVQQTDTAAGNTAVQKTNPTTGGPPPSATTKHTAPTSPLPDLRPHQEKDICMPGEAAPTPDDMLSTFRGQWGEQACVVLRNACMDESTFLTFGDDPYNPLEGEANRNYSRRGHEGREHEMPRHQLKLARNHLDMHEFGDVAGLIMYPPPIIRAGGMDEESPDLQAPQHFSECVRPVVLYFDYVNMFGDWWARTMPVFMHAMAAGAWDTRYAIILATGGQKLQRWQKLMLQTLTDHPVMTLSAASSRAIAAQHTTSLQPAAASTAESPVGLSSAAAAARAATSAAGTAAARAGRAPLAHAATANAAKNMQGSGMQQHPQRVIPWDQPQAAPVAATLRETTGTATATKDVGGPATAGVPVTAYGRCFEVLTLCSTQGTNVFPFKSSSSSSVVPRARWAGAQYVKQYYMQRYAQEYHYLLPQYKRLQEPKAFRVVFALRPPMIASAAAAMVHSSTSSTGEHLDPTEDQLAVSVRQVLNIQEVMQWCNAWKPTAAGAGGVVAERYTHTVCVGHVFGQHGKVEVAPRAAGSSGGSSLRRQLREWTSKVRRLLGGGPSDPTAAAGSAQPCDGCDPELDPRALMTDLAVLDHAGE